VIHVREANLHSLSVWQETMQPSSIAVLLDLDAAAAYKRGRLLEMVPTMYIFGFSNHTGIPSRNAVESVR
jgi:hypothetical protein